MGPAGSMAAIQAARAGGQVDIFDQNEKLGKKLYLTGKGRCNLTNATPFPQFFDGVAHNMDFLYSSFYSFTNEDLVNFFESRGRHLKVERGGRVFPKSDHSSDINKTLEISLQEEGCRLHKNSLVTTIHFDQGKNQFIFNFKGGRREAFDRCILATGGRSYPATGSRGDGYRFAEAFGHTIKPPKASLVGFLLQEDWLDQVQGLALRNVRLTAKTRHEEFSEFGECLFTHNGISGPIVLTLSALLASRSLAGLDLFLDLKPALVKEDLARRLMKARQEAGKKAIKTILTDFLPRSLIPVFLEKAGLDPGKQMAVLRAEEEDRIIALFKHFPLAFQGFDSIDHAIITRGGVNVKEVNPSTLESKLQPGLFFAGEVLDVDGFTGGYNLQIAFSTGFLAGQSAGLEQAGDKK